jgi:hypothetical protein
MQTTIKVIYSVLFVILALSYLFLRTVTLLGMAQVHRLMEVTATFVAFFVSAMGLIRFYSRKKNIFLFSGLMRL